MSIADFMDMRMAASTEVMVKEHAKSVLSKASCRLS